MRNPRNRAEWQEAVNLAHGALSLDDCRMYGLLAGGPAVDRERCLEILKRGRARGITPEQGSGEALAVALSCQEFRDCSEKTTPPKPTKP